MLLGPQREWKTNGKLKDLLELSSQNDIELHVIEVVKRYIILQIAGKEIFLPKLIDKT